MKVVSIVGARPQFVKAAVVGEAIRREHAEVLVHTGQHYDGNMSDAFFADLGLPPPVHHLGVGSAPHGAQTAAMLAGIESVLLSERPDAVIVYGDTNSTLAGALASVKLGVPVAHVEAGLRSFNRSMPEEHNRVLTDHCATWLFCPTDTAVANLAREGLWAGVHCVGDVMWDAVERFAAVAEQRSRALRDHDLESRGYVLATIHRAYNTDDALRLRAIIAGLLALDEAVVLPIHPRTRAALAREGVDVASGPGASRIRLIEPVGYLDMLVLERHARVIVTDSGGVQKEAYFFGVPCVTVRPETEWTETTETGWNVLVDADPGRIAAVVRASYPPDAPRPPLFGDGRASDRIAAILGAAR